MNDTYGTLANTQRSHRIFRMMSNPNRMTTMRILNSRGTMTYSELKSAIGLKNKRDSGKFSYHLRELLKLALLSYNQTEKTYSITNLGRMALNVAQQVEECSIMESGQKYVRTSSRTIEEFDPLKITRSMAREGGILPEVAQKITEEVKDRIYKYQTAHLTGPLIRELTNVILLENGHEDYRNKMIRLGMPIHDVHTMMNDIKGVQARSLIMEAGRNVFDEYALANSLSNEVGDMYMAGDIHISHLPFWSLIPDTIFADITGHIQKSGGAVPYSITAILGSISGEVSQECVVGGFGNADLSYEDVYRILRTMNSTTPLSLRVRLSEDVAADMLGAYGAYCRETPGSSVRIIAETDNHTVDEFAPVLASIFTMGGSITVSPTPAASSGIVPQKAMSATIHNTAINLPRLALESKNDESYFRAKLAMHIDAIMPSIENRRKDVLDITHRGLNPFLKRMLDMSGDGALTTTINMLGIHEAVSGVMGYSGPEAHQIIKNTISTATEAANGKNNSAPPTVAIVSSPGSRRLVELDKKAYGKKKVASYSGHEEYTMGAVWDVNYVLSTGRSDAEITRIKEISGMLKGGLLTRLLVPKDTPQGDLEEAIRISSRTIGYTISRL